MSGKSELAVCARNQGLSNRRRVHDSAARPSLVDATRNAQLRFHTNVSVVDFAVVANLPNDARGPVRREPDPLAIVTIFSDEPLHCRLG